MNDLPVPFELRIPRAQRAEWIALSRSAGLKLADFVTAHVERSLSLGALPSALDISKHPLVFLSNADLSSFARTQCAEMVQSMRSSLGASKLELSQSLGKEPSTVRKWELGTNTPSGADLALLALATNQHPHYLLFNRAASLVVSL